MIRLQRGMFRAMCIVTGIASILCMVRCNVMPVGSSTPDEQADTATAMIVADQGGIIATPEGIVLQIPPGALSDDTEITLLRIPSDKLREVDPGFIAGVTLLPDGLTFNEPAELHVPLPEAWPAGDPPLELIYKGDDPVAAVETGGLVQLTPDRTTAIFQVSHFSGRVCARQCHAGVREFLTAQFRARGCDQSDWAPRVTGKYGVDPDADCASIRPGEIHAIIDTFFEDYGGWNMGEDIPAASLDELEAIASSGREIVFFYKNDVFDARGGPQQFYPGLAHSAIMEFRNGQWMLRNSFVPGDVPLESLGGVPLIWSPLRNVNQFRNDFQGVAIERAICGAPGCLGSDEVGSGKPYRPLEFRPITPWDAVRVFVEREENVPCNRLAGCWRFSQEDAGGGTLLLRFNEEGQLDSLWVSGLSSDDASPQVFAEFVRFSRPNAPQIAAGLENVDHGTFLAVPDQSQFAMSFSFDLVSRRSNGDVATRTTYSVTINDAQFSKNTPEEYFDGLLVQEVRSVSIDEEGNEEVTVRPFSGMVRGHRTTCPNEADGTGVVQESLIDGQGKEEFDIEVFNQCGAGALGATPLTALGLLSLSVARRRRRRAIKR